MAKQKLTKGNWYYNMTEDIFCQYVTDNMAHPTQVGCVCSDGNGEPYTFTCFKASLTTPEKATEMLVDEYFTLWKDADKECYNEFFMYYYRDELGYRNQFINDMQNGNEHPFKVIGVNIEFWKSLTEIMEEFDFLLDSFETKLKRFKEFFTNGNEKGTSIDDDLGYVMRNPSRTVEDEMYDNGVSWSDFI